METAFEAFDRNDVTHLAERARANLLYLFFLGGVVVEQTDVRAPA